MTIQSRPYSPRGRKNYDKIFKKPVPKPRQHKCTAESKPNRKCKCNNCTCEESTK